MALDHEAIPGSLRVVCGGHLGLGKLYRLAGHQRAQAHFTTATTLYREIDMRFWLEIAEKEMGELH